MLADRQAGPVPGHSPTESHEGNLAGADLPGESRTSQIEITYYTDPLCSWSWAFEAEWRRLRYEFGNQLGWRYVMGGLLADWERFSDPLNDITRPIQMGPHWLQVKYLAGVPIEERIWHTDPPASSYPACIAVKAAERQGAAAGEAYLRRLREAVMLEQRNIARRDVLIDLAETLAAQRLADVTFDVARFQADMDQPALLDAFRDDLKDARYRDIGRFPTLILRASNGQAIIIVGYRPYDALRAALASSAPDLQPIFSAADAVAYIKHWGSATAREVAEAMGQDQQRTVESLDAAVRNGELVQTGLIYRDAA